MLENECICGCGEKTKGGNSVPDMIKNFEKQSKMRSEGLKASVPLLRSILEDQ